MCNSNIKKIIAELREAESKATPGPWVAIPLNLRWHGYDPKFKDGLWHILPEDDVERLPIATVDSADDIDEQTRKDAENEARLIVLARNHLKALLEHVASQTAALRACGEALRDAVTVARCTRFVTYPDGHWSRRAERILDLPAVKAAMKGEETR